MSQYVIVNGELYHHGVKGMKWGVRRKLEQVGTAVKNRASQKVEDYKTTRRLNRAQKEADRRKLKESKYRGTLDNADLKSKIQRLRDERDLRTLTAEEVRPGRTAAKRIMGQIGTQVVTRVAATAISGAALYGVKAAITKDFNAGDFASAVFNGGAKKK